MPKVTATSYAQRFASRANTGLGVTSYTAGSGMAARRKQAILGTGSHTWCWSHPGKGE